jgi:hypothetical protein
MTLVRFETDNSHQVYVKKKRSLGKVQKRGRGKGQNGW